MKNILLGLTFVFLSILQLGCFNKKGIQKSDVTMSNNKEVNFTVIKGGVNSGYKEKGYIVINNEQQLKKIWNKIFSIMIPPPSVPYIDFENSTLIGVFMGEKPTGGYGIEITKITEQKNKITVDIKEISPAPDCIVTMVLTSPYKIIKINKTNKKIKFKIEEVVKECN